MKKESKGIYSGCWRYLKESRKYFLFVSIVFLLSVFLGFLFPVFFVDIIREFIEEILAKAGCMSFFQPFLFILQNNIITAFSGFILGIFLGVFPLVLTFLNGYVLGFVANLSVGSAGFTSLWSLFPHGIFELPALIISLGLGLKMASFIFAKNKEKKFMYDLKNSLRVFLFIIVPLLIIAGLIETGLIVLLS